MTSEHSKRGGAGRLALPVALTLAGVGAGVAAMLATSGAWWVRGAGGAAGGLAGLVAATWIDRASQRREAERRQRRVVRQALQGTTGKGGDVLPLVRDAPGLEVRVHHAVLPLPYIRRDAEEEVRSCLGSGQPVLLVGSSMVGKTRIAATVIRDMFADRPIVIPDGEEALAALDAADVALQGSVVFLDDINRLIGAGGITDGTISRLASAQNAIVGTIRATVYDGYEPTNQVRRPEWDVVSVFKRVFVTRELSEREQDRLSEAVNDSSIRERILQTGLGEYVGAAEHIAEELRLGPSVSPAGYALVLGAADWQRSGMRTPVPGSLLPVLAAPHLDARDRADLTDGQAYREAVRWATREINPTVALLQQEESDRFAVFDYAIDLISRQAKPIPETTWPLVIKHADPPELVNVGYIAWANHGQDQVAISAWRKAAQSERPDVVSRAELYLGIELFDHQKDLKGAEEALKKAIDSGDAEQASLAAGWLGVVLFAQEDLKGAQEAYQRAIDIGPAGALSVAVAVNNLVDLLADQGDIEGARVAYQKAIDSGIPEQPEVARRLKVLPDPDTNQ